MPEGDDAEMRSFWDEKAADNPLWYVHSGLDFAAPDEAEFWASGEREVAAALAAAGVESGGVAVDIGCGAGRLSRALAPRFERLWSFDVSPRMIEVAARNLAAFGNVTLAPVAGDGRLPLPDRSADVVLSLQVFQHIPARAATLSYIREAGRVLGPAGAFAFQLRSLRMAGPVLGRLERGVRAVLDRARRLRRPPPPALDSRAWHGSRLGIWEIRAAARASGMRVERLRWISKRGASLFVVCRKG